MSIVLVKPWDIIFWIRAVMGVLAGILSGLVGYVGPDNPEAYRGLILAMAFYGLSYYIARFGMSVEVGKGVGKKFFTAGLGSFIILFLFSWILINTFLHVP